MKRNDIITELMDDPDCDRKTLLRTYKQFGIINHTFSKWRGIYKLFIRPKLNDPTKTYTLLDVGCGFMDNSKLIQDLALKDGFTIQITGIDPNPVLKELYANAVFQSDQEFKSAYLNEIDKSLKFDFVISNHLMHHLSESQISELLTDISSKTNTLAVMNDIHRSVWALLGFSIITLPFKGWTFIHTDGIRSIRRSFIPDELEEILPSNWGVKTLFPFRLLAVYEPT
jgi:2-polyprenyl-3-methyl-5-hydroxy-6-metoxy-1,4-benzoquinol methylase